MRTMHITLIAGARPNFMKIAPLIKAIKEWKPTSGNVLRTATGSPIEQSSSPAQGREIIIPCREGAVRILELQAPGKKRMDAKSFLNGLH